MAVNQELLSAKCWRHPMFVRTASWIQSILKNFTCQDGPRLALLPCGPRHLPWCLTQKKFLESSTHRYQKELSPVWPLKKMENNHPQALGYYLVGHYLLRTPLVTTNQLTLKNKPLRRSLGPDLSWEAPPMTNWELRWRLRKSHKEVQECWWPKDTQSVSEAKQISLNSIRI